MPDLELPHLDDTSTGKSVTLWLNGEGRAAPFSVLSGKNMTVTDVRSGRRTGACVATPPF